MKYCKWFGLVWYLPRSGKVTNHAALRVLGVGSWISKSERQPSQQKCPLIHDQNFDERSFDHLL